MTWILAMQSETIWDLALKGGPVMWPILLASVLGFAVFIERLIRLRTGAVVPSGLGERVRRLVTEGKEDDARRVVSPGTTPLHRVLARVLEDYRSSGNESIEEQGEREYRLLYRGVEFIGVMAGISPLLGLLGTVTGMIQVFRRVMSTATVRGIDPAMLAGGIWEALITTAAGLMVAIPLFLAYRYLQHRVDSLMFELQEEAKDLARTLDGAGPSPAGEQNGSDDS